jgi:hypothetical protein
VDFFLSVFGELEDLGEAACGLAPLFTACTFREVLASATILPLPPGFHPHSWVACY